MPELRYLENVVSLKYDQEKCIGCAMCETVCPHGVFVMEQGKAAIDDLDLCMECGACMQNCPSGAITVEKGEGCVRGIINELLGIDGPCC